MSNANEPKQELPVRPGTHEDPSSPREIQNPGDPGPPVLVPPEHGGDPGADPRISPMTPPHEPGV